MNLDPHTRLAWALALWRQRPVEAGLALLGIVGGVAGLVVAVALVQGARHEMMRALGDLGTGTLMVRSLSSEGLPQSRFEALARLLNGLVIVPVREDVMAVSSDHHAVAGAQILATTADYAPLFGLRLRSGRFLAPVDAMRQERICILGAALAAELHPHGDSVGRRVRLGRVWHTVVGQLEPQPWSGEGTLPSLDPVAIVPLPGMQGGMDRVVIRFADHEHLGRWMGAVKRIVEFGRDDSTFEYVLPLHVVREQYRLNRMVALLLVGVTGVLLVLGGISVANVMLMNVLRRRGEIGLRRALGASRGDILTQFIFECTVVCAVGGIAGTLFGLGIIPVLTFAVGWTLVGSTTAAAGGVVAALGVGMLAGCYPAWQAARVDPVRALAGL